MKKIKIITALLFLVYGGFSQTTFIPSRVSFDDYLNLVNEVNAHRKSRLISLNEFLKQSKTTGVVILDTRSDSMYLSKHIKGAIHLNFSDFTQQNLAKLIPNTNTKILIYCNNNFNNDKINFADKAFIPAKLDKVNKSITLALNIPTYINLYGYDYKNVFELSELVSVFDSRVVFEGTSISKKK